jgi:hypothetical protein
MTTSSPLASTLCTQYGPLVPNSAGVRFSVRLAGFLRGTSVWNRGTGVHITVWTHPILQQNSSWGPWTVGNTKKEKDKRFPDREKLQEKRASTNLLWWSFPSKPLPRQIRKLLIPSSSKRTLHLQDQFLAKQTTTHNQQIDLHNLCTWRQEANVYSRKDQGNLEQGSFKYNFAIGCVPDSPESVTLGGAF